MRTRQIFRVTTLLTLGAVFGGCTIENITEEATEGTNPPPTVPPPDTDGDGLTDEREVVLGTSPLMAGTDGDGFDDNEEVTNGGTHPLIADVPSL